MPKNISDLKVNDRFLFQTRHESQVREGVIVEVAGEFVNCGYGHWQRASNVQVLAELPALPKIEPASPPPVDLTPRVEALEKALAAKGN